MLALRSNGKTVAATGYKSWPLARAQGAGPRIFNSLPQHVNLLGGGSADYAQLYWTQPAVYAVINKLVRTIAALELKTYSYDDSRNPVEAPTAVPAKVLRSPYPRAGAYQLKEFIMGSLCVWGNATLVKFRGGAGRTPAELWPMPFQRVTIIEGRDKPIEAYQYMSTSTTGSIGQKALTFLPEDIVHLTWFNPDGKPWGRSPLEALASTIALEDAGRRYALASYGNNARPASFIVSDKKLSKEQRAQLAAEIDAAYGGPDNAFKVALLDNGLDWKPIGHSAHESALIENRKISREEVCEVYDIPPPLIGILDHASLSNLSEQHVMLYQTTIAPILGMLDDTINAQFMDEDAWSNLFVRFDMGEVVRGNFDQRSQAYQRQFNSGMATPNELRKFEGRPPIGDPDDADNPANMIYVPVNTAPVGEHGMLRPMVPSNSPGSEAGAGSDLGPNSPERNGHAGGLGGLPQQPATPQP